MFKKPKAYRYGYEKIKLAIAGKRTNLIIFTGDNQPVELTYSRYTSQEPALGHFEA